MDTIGTTKCPDQRGVLTLEVVLYSSLTTCTCSWDNRLRKVLYLFQRPLIERFHFTHTRPEADTTARITCITSIPFVDGFPHPLPSGSPWWLPRTSADWRRAQLCHTGRQHCQAPTPAPDHTNAYHLISYPTRNVCVRVCKYIKVIFYSPLGGGGRQQCPQRKHTPPNQSKRSMYIYMYAIAWIQVTSWQVQARGILHVLHERTPNLRIALWTVCFYTVPH